MIKTVDGAKFHDVQIASCRILATTTVFINHIMKVEKTKFHFLYLHFIFELFSVLFMKDLKICGAEMLFIDMLCNIAR